MGAMMVDGIPAPHADLGGVAFALDEWSKESTAETVAGIAVERPAAPPPPLERTSASRENGAEGSEAADRGEPRGELRGELRGEAPLESRGNAGATDPS